MTVSSGSSDGSPRGPPQLVLSPEAIAKIMPFYVLIDPEGTIIGAGPTLLRVLGQGICGRLFLDVFSIDRPRSVQSLADVYKRSGTKLMLSAQDEDSERIIFRAMPIELGGGDRGLLIDLAFGAHFAEVVARNSLTSADFRPNDLSIDLLYTFETQRALLKDGEDLAAALTKAKVEAEHLAMCDLVTGLANRRALNQRLLDVLSGEYGDGPHALLLVDLDKFKAVNDDFGHAAGDAVLNHAATCIASAAGPNGFAARIGGDEFALVLSDGGADGICIAERLIDSISDPIQFETVNCQIGASVGHLTFQSDHCETPDQLMQEADVALYQAKSSLAGYAAVTPDLLGQNADQRALIVDIERALSKGEFVPYFQPQINVTTGHVVGLEVLARWNHPTRGILAPFHFLNIAAKANLLVSLDRQVRQQALTLFRGLSDTRLTHATLSINLTAANLRNDEFVDDLLGEIDLAGLPPSQIQLELLETIFFDERDNPFIRQCQSLRRAGFGLALDDFGTGHASISTLIDAPISLVKIDRSFVSGIDGNDRLRRITGSIIHMAQDVGLSVLAEGVETKGELDQLTGLDCHLVQGYYFAKPMGIQGLTLWLNKRLGYPDAHSWMDVS